MTDTISSVDTEYQQKNKLRDIYQTVFMIHKVLIVHQETSLPVFVRDIENTVTIEDAMITSILQAISTIGQEMVGRPTGFKKLQYHGFVITGAYCEGFTVYVFSETELVKEIEQGMQDLVQWFSATFSSLRDNWDGSLDVYKMSRAIIKSKIAQNLFLWLLYPLQTSKDQTLDKGRISDTAKLIFECIEKNLRCTAARILDGYKEYDEEKILYEIFNLVIDGYIETSSDDR
ncbi:MAG: hypothetical protein GOP50_06825 [Candidatus Heimdallarchaeota archaeon]|nr:hypothetical protein [Candidatus Heimdallarchaeota archaeon]